MWYIYILKSSVDGSYYKGLTNNLERRIIQHKNGQSNSTKYKRPLKLIYTETFLTRKAARMREKYFKSGVGREKIKELDN